MITSLTHHILAYILEHKHLTDSQCKIHTNKFITTLVLHYTINTHLKN